MRHRTDNFIYSIHSSQMLKQSLHSVIHCLFLYTVSHVLWDISPHNCKAVNFVILRILHWEDRCEVWSLLEKNHTHINIYTKKYRWNFKNGTLNIYVYWYYLLCLWDTFGKVSHLSHWNGDKFGSLID